MSTLVPFFEYLLEGWQLDNEVDVLDPDHLARGIATHVALKNYIDHIVWCEIPVNLTSRPAHTEFMFTYNGVSVYYCYGADHYLFADDEYED